MTWGGYSPTKDSENEEEGLGGLGGGVLDDHRHAHPHTDAHGRQAVAGAAAAELPGERAEQPGARGAQGVAERDRAAVHVQLLERDPELPRRREHLRGERLV